MAVADKALVCSFCKSLPPRAQTPNGEVKVCGRCATSMLPKLLAAALAEDGAQLETVKFSLAGEISSINVTPLRRRPAARTPAARPAAQPAARMTPQQTALALLRADARQRGQVVKGDPEIAARLRKLGFATCDSELETALSAGTGTGTATTATATTRTPPARVPTPPRKPTGRPAPKKLDPREMLEKIGVETY